MLVRRLLGAAELRRGGPDHRDFFGGVRQPRQRGRGHVRQDSRGPAEARPFRAPARLEVPGAVGMHAEEDPGARVLGALGSH